MLAEPSRHVVDPASGALSAATGSYEKRLRDLAGVYGDAAAFDAACATSGDRVVYKVEDVRPAARHGDLIFGTTFMEPGKIADEFFVTRGHVHALGNRPETYYGEAGEGLMLMESPEGEVRILKIAPRVLVYVPPFWIHRSINIGASPLVMSFCYPADSGQDYDVISKAGGMAVRVVADGDGWRDVPNPDYRPRGPDEIAALYTRQD
ncbi:MAG: glucose-6-phosphate isomerase family protein [Paracoccaceae bacterium]|nr:glucose-6-phosphate isomerase family protein [Paracoccaceae bacterium]